MSKKVLIIVHKELIPDLTQVINQNERSNIPWITEFDVAKALTKIKINFDILGIDENLDEFIKKLQSKSYSIVFNLLEEFKSNTRMESKIVALMELYGQKHTGCNSKGLLIAKDKALSKKILKFHHLASANFFTLARGKKRKVPKSLSFPLIVKCLYEEASLGIAKASIVHNEQKLNERIQYIHEQLNQDVIIEEFIEGREFYVGVIGKNNLKTLPIIELQFNKTKSPEKEIYSSQAKWNESYRRRNGIETKIANLEKSLTQKINRFCKKSYRELNLTGYARMDLRLTSDNKIYLLEANPNPNIAMDDDFAKSAKAIGVNYPELIEQLCK